MELWPFQKPHPPLWYGVVTPDSAERVGQGAHEHHRQRPRPRRSAPRSPIATRAAYQAPAGGGETPSFGMNRYMVLAETEDEALEIARRAYRRWWANFMTLWHKHNMPPTNVNYPPEIDGQIADGRAIVRHAATKALATAARRRSPNRAPTISSAASPSAI